MVLSSYLTLLSFAFIPLSKSERFTELFGFSAGSVGVTLSTLQTVLCQLQWGVRQLSESENHLTSVERLLEYAKLEPELSLGKGFTDIISISGKKSIWGEKFTVKCFEIFTCEFLCKRKTRSKQK